MIVALKASYCLCTLPLLFYCLFVGIFYVVWEACPFVAMAHPNSLAPTKSVPADIVLRGSRDAKLNTMIGLWPPAGRIEFQPRAEGHHSCTTEVLDLYDPRTAAGPSHMASGDTTKEDTQLPWIATNTVTAKSQLVLHKEGTKRYRDML